MILFESIASGVEDIRNNVGRTMLQVTGIILGVGSIVATFALAAAGKEASQQFYKVSGGIEKISIRNKAMGKVTLDAKALASQGLTFRDVNAIKNAPHIDLISPVSEENMDIRYQNVEKNFSVMGVMPAYSPMNDFRAGSGRFITDADVSSAERVVVLGSTRAREIFSTDNPVGKTVTMNGTGYRVVGVMEEKYFSFDGGQRNALAWMNKQMYVPITTLMTRRGEAIDDGKVSWMHARMRSVKDADVAVKELETILRREHGVKDFEVFSRVDRLKKNEENGKMYDVTFMVCGIISLIVGGIVVMNIQLASFNERVREVGVRKALGATPLQIFGQFITESVLVTGVGGLLGLIVGNLFTQGIAKLTNNPAIITPQVIITALIFGAGTGLVFGLYPAVRASRLNAIEALRVD